MGEYIKIAKIKDIVKNQMQVSNVKGQEILVVNVEGKFFAIENRCPTWDTLFSLEALKAIH